MTKRIYDFRASALAVALAAYAAYAVNATQFLLKLRAARLERPALRAVTP